MNLSVGFNKFKSAESRLPVCWKSEEKELCSGGGSCETQLHHTITDIVKDLDIGKEIMVDILLLDFCKAFNRVSPRRLQNKLRWYGIPAQSPDFLEGRCSNIASGHYSDLTMSYQECLRG